jgi:hypothetical protein
MFQTVTVHPQELLCRYCMCRLWYVVRKALPDTSSWYNVLGRTAKMVHGPSSVMYVLLSFLSQVKSVGYMPNLQLVQ